MHGRRRAPTSRARSRCSPGSATINASILVFNLIPAFPLDGGRIARAIAWKLTGDRERATRFAARIGQGFAIIFIAIGVVLFAAQPGRLVGGIWLALIGWMLGQSARATGVRSELSRIGGLRVADVMDAEPVAIPDDTSVERALDEYFLRYRWPWFPVVDAGPALRRPAQARRRRRGARAEPHQSQTVSELTPATATAMTPQRPRRRAARVAARQRRAAPARRPGGGRRRRPAVAA